MAETPVANKFFQEVFLQQTEGPGKGRRFPLRDGKNVLGRNGDIVLENDQISRQHACVIVEDTISIEDMGSSFGTVLNGKMLVGSSFIFDKDEIHLGPYGFRLSARKREDRKGLLWAGFTVLVGMVFILVAFFAYQSSMDNAVRVERRLRTEYIAESRTGNDVEVYAQWKDWEQFHLPGRLELDAESIKVDSKTAEIEFNLAMQLYQERLVEPGNAYRALVHFKICMGILNLLPYRERPPLARRSLDMIDELSTAIRTNCEDRVFSYIRAYQMQYWKGCFEALQRICDYSPQPESPYNIWAKERIIALNKALHQ